MSSTNRKIFIGYDPNLENQYLVAEHSLRKRLQSDIEIVKLNREEMVDKGLWYRPSETTDFTHLRFLVPYLMDYKGWGLFLDSDILVLDDVTKLFDLAEDKYSVMCVKHQFSNPYIRWNWASVMLMNCSKCRNLTPYIANNYLGDDLLRLQWAENNSTYVESSIGELPEEWNCLVSRDKDKEKVLMKDQERFEGNIQMKNPKIVHYTHGVPEIEGCENSRFADVWWKELKETK